MAGENVIVAKPTTSASVIKDTLEKTVKQVTSCDLNLVPQATAHIEVHFAYQEPNLIGKSFWT